MPDTSTIIAQRTIKAITSSLAKGWTEAEVTWYHLAANTWAGGQIKIPWVPGILVAQSILGILMLIVKELLVYNSA